MQSESGPGPSRNMQTPNQRGLGAWEGLLASVLNKGAQHLASIINNLLLGMHSRRCCHFLDIASRCVTECWDDSLLYFTARAGSQNVGLLSRVGILHGESKCTLHVWVCENAESSYADAFQISPMRHLCFTLSHTIVR